METNEAIVGILLETAGKKWFILSFMITDFGCFGKSNQDLRLLF